MGYIEIRKKTKKRKKKSPSFLIKTLLHSVARALVSSQSQSQSQSSIDLRPMEDKEGRAGLNTLRARWQLSDLWRWKSSESRSDFKSLEILVWKTCSSFASAFWGSEVANVSAREAWMASELISWAVRHKGFLLRPLSLRPHSTFRFLLLILMEERGVEW